VADKLEAESKNGTSAASPDALHHRWALGATAMQIAIALSAIALLTRRHWLLMGLRGVGESARRSARWRSPGCEDPTPAPPASGRGENQAAFHRREKAEAR